jgi:very-short-patch-repair endonuclease
MTRAEILLWRYLKANHLGELSFRRQAPVGTYIVDFVCHAACLVVEVDGETHDFESRQRSDSVRDAWLGTRGYIVLRFANDDVLSNLEGVLLTVLDAARSRLTTPPSLSLPRKGGGNPKTNTPRTARHRAIRIRQEKRS